MTSRGRLIQAVATTLFDRRTMERIVNPAIVDLQIEPFSIAGYLAVLKVVVWCAGGGEMLRKTMRCSFCRRPDSQVAKLVAGPWRIFAGRVYICDRCATQTIQIMEASSGGETPSVPRISMLGRLFSRFRERRTSLLRLDLARHGFTTV